MTVEKKVVCLVANLDSSGYSAFFVNKERNPWAMLKEMKRRCRNGNRKDAKWYHDKGIKVCEEWRCFRNFLAWYGPAMADAMLRYGTTKLSIDRIDNNGDYCPSNCQFITVSENSRKAMRYRWSKVKKGE